MTITPDGKLAVVAAPSRYDYDAKKELLDSFIQVVDLEATPPRLIGEAAQGVVFSQDSKQVLLQLDIDRAIVVYAIRDGRIVDTGTRIALAAGPVSMRSMPR